MGNPKFIILYQLKIKCLYGGCLLQKRDPRDSLDKKMVHCDKKMKRHRLETAFQERDKRQKVDQDGSASPELNILLLERDSFADNYKSILLLY